MSELVSQLKECAGIEDEVAPARVPLVGVHNLVYSDSDGSSSGKIFGPIYGRVTQVFVDDVVFRNRVDLGPLRLALTAERKVMDDRDIQVTFKSVCVELFGQRLVEKTIDGGGTWKMIHVGKVRVDGGDDEGDRKKEKLVRIFEAPSLFVIEQDL